MQKNFEAKLTNRYALDPQLQNKFVHPKYFPFVNFQIKQIAILCHRNADPDSYCSAFAIYQLLRILEPKLKVHIFSPNEFGPLTRRVANKFRTRTLDSFNISEYDLLIIVDTGEISLLGEIGEKIILKNPPKIFIDHHPLLKSTLPVVDYVIVDDSVSSCCEIIYNIYKLKKISLTKQVANALLTGILFDSQNLTLTKESTLITLARLCQKGASLSTCRNLLNLPKNMSETVARLKAAKRIKAYRLNDWIITITEIGSFQASAANALLALGADLTLAICKRGSEIRGSMRSTQSFFLQTKLHLGMDIAHKVASELDGKGGGHPTAASFRLRGSLIQTIERILFMITNKLGIESKEIEI